MSEYEDDTIDDAVVYQPPYVPDDVWQAALRAWQCDPSDELGYRQPETNVGQQRLKITCRAIMAERESARANVIEQLKQAVERGV